MILLPEHLYIFPKSWEFPNKEHHLKPRKEAANSSRVELPPGNNNLCREGIAVDRDEGEGDDECHVYVGVPLPEVPLGDGQHLDDLIHKIEKGEHY